MNWSRVEGNWNEMKGRVKEKWGKLTDDDLSNVGGKRDRLVGVLQQKYGMAKDKVEEQLESFFENSEGWVAEAKDKVSEVYDKGREYLQSTSPTDMAGDLREVIGRYPVQSVILGVGIGFLIGQVFGRTSHPSRG
jgi:uncharacterized protein YjbJ (UPF0337 family)